MAVMISSDTLSTKTSTPSHNCLRENETSRNDPTSPDINEYTTEDDRDIEIIGEKRKISVIELDDDSTDSSVEILSDPASPEEEYIEPNTDETDVDTTMEEDTDSIDDGEHGQQDRIVTWARDFMDQEEASMETGDGDAVQENNTEEGKSINNVETDLAILVQEVTEACANLHTLTLRDVQLFLIRLNQLEMRSDGQVLSR